LKLIKKDINNKIIQIHPGGIGNTDTGSIYNGFHILFLSFFFDGFGMQGMVNESLPFIARLLWYLSLSFISDKNRGIVFIDFAQEVKFFPNFFLLQVILAIIRVG